MIDDYELGLIIGHTLKVEDVHRIDPVMLETLGAELRPPLTDLATQLGKICEIVAALPPDTLAAWLDTA